ncbi:cyclic nucleotide-binding domain-containing protein [Pseudenhygromyxa sp. WMMC2535]|uniref:cyclic nucleotide-binding domain-containing protein n=1 Tax=Pseudenhygromyxa sp. WMMC2535 TaxID=2712867 RepID=UPI001552BD99|nr:cyclic nucleotide-binding domain-containing protein [Pseudenhygromyxa sp. WMMC2535]NVB42035.1 cyclic nucleotide-binding domain-containing protein [Pseudenhygromyxa sp. WMMC2535]
MQIQAYGGTDVGRRRSHNEDTILVDEGLGLFMVCDGMGGHAAGEVASKTAAEAVRRRVGAGVELLRGFDGSAQACEQVEALLRDAIAEASAEVYDLARGDDGRHGMGTTCIALLVARAPSGAIKGIMGHVGDSRMYLVREQGVWQLSQDHTFFNDAVRHGLMSYEVAKASPWAGQLTRGVGIQRNAVVDTLVFDIVESDTILLCSDGLTAYIHEHHELASMLADPRVDRLPARLISVANERGGGDNVSAVVVRGAPELPAQLSDSRRRDQVTNDLRTLRHIALFMDLSDAELVRIYHRFGEADYPAGSVMIREDDNTDSLFILVEGSATVSKGERQISTLTRGAHFGEMGLLNQRPRSATVTATSPVHALVLERAGFNDVLLQDTSLAAKLLYKLAQILSLRLDETISVELDDLAARRTVELGVLSPFRRS